MYNSYSPIELMAANNAVSQMIVQSHEKAKKYPNNSYYQAVKNYWLNKKKQLPTQYDLV